GQRRQAFVLGQGHTEIVGGKQFVQRRFDLRHQVVRRLAVGNVLQIGVKFVVRLLGLSVLQQLQRGLESLCRRFGGGRGSLWCDCRTLIVRFRRRAGRKAAGQRQQNRNLHAAQPFERCHPAALRVSTTVSGTKGNVLDGSTLRFAPPIESVVPTGRGADSNNSTPSICMAHRDDGTIQKPL